MIIKGQKIDGRYQIIRTIGEGGMANVYLAYDTILEREVAVKILRGDLASDEKFVKRFQREAKAASSLNHPNIVEMYDVGEDDGNYFIVMEYVNGKTLKSLIKKRGGLSLSEVVDIMQQLTSGIACAHDSYIIHRDLKPQNVMILEDGRVKITDFGIAVALNSTELTQTNSVMGSVHYLPPEQANGSGATIKSDIYSLGILMYELLTGKLPFKGDNAVEIALKQMRDKIPSIRENNPSVPQSVENIVLKACAKNPKNRYDSALDMYNDLTTCLSEERKDEKKLVYEYPDTEYEEKEKEEVKEEKTIKNNKKEKKVKEVKAVKPTKEEVINTAKPKKKKISIFGIIVSIFGVLASITIISLLVYASYLFGNTDTKKVYLPDISGKTQEYAEKKLSEINVYYDIEEAPSSDVEEDLVIGYKSKKTNSPVKQGSIVTILISSGEAGVEIEDYTGRNVEVVQIELETQGFKVIKTSKKVSTTEEGYKDAYEGKVIGQDKKPGSRLEVGGAIELVYATIITVYPDFVKEKYTKDKAKQFCEDNEITCIFVEKESDEKPGTIIAQGRNPGVEVKPNKELTITIAKKPSGNSESNE